VPSFRPFKAEDPYHEAVSIVAIRYGEHPGLVYAHHVKVGHVPFQLLQFTVFEQDEWGRIVGRTISREDLLTRPVEEIGRMVGAVSLGKEEKQRTLAISTLSEEEMNNLSSAIYDELIMDSYARPLYPPGGVHALLGDTGLVQKWSLANAVRFAASGS